MPEKNSKQKTAREPKYRRVNLPNGWRKDLSGQDYADYFEQLRVSTTGGAKLLGVARTTLYRLLRKERLSGMDALAFIGLQRVLEEPYDPKMLAKRHIEEAERAAALAQAERLDGGILPKAFQLQKPLPGKTRLWAKISRLFGH